MEIAAFISSVGSFQMAYVFISRFYHTVFCISRELSLSRTKTFFIFLFQEYDALQVRIILLYKDSNLFIW